MSAKQYALVLLPKLTGAISMTFSSLIIYSILGKNRRHKSHVYDRLILGISIADLLGSFGMFLSTWPIPSSNNNTLWAMGNQTTCNLQGLFTQGATSASAIYSAMLTFYFLLVARFQWKHQRLKRYEWCFHIVPIVWGTGTSIASIPLRLYNNANLWCYIAETDDPGRGHHADVYRMAFFYGPLYLLYLIVTVNVCIVVSYVRGLTTRAMNHSFTTRMTDGSAASIKNGDDGDEDLSSHDEDDHFLSMNGSDPVITRHKEQTTGGRDLIVVPNGESSLRDSITKSSQCRDREVMRTNRYARWRRKVSLQNLRFSAAFYCTWTPICCVRMLQLWEHRVPFWLILIATITTPLQGLPNLLVYFYPKYRKFRKQNKDTCKLNIVKWIQAGMQTTVVPHSQHRRDEERGIGNDLVAAADASGPTKNGGIGIVSVRVSREKTETSIVEPVPSVTSPSQPQPKEMELEIRNHVPLSSTSSMTTSENESTVIKTSWKIHKTMKNVSSITMSDLDPIEETGDGTGQKWLESRAPHDMPLKSPRRLDSKISKEEDEAVVIAPGRCDISSKSPQRAGSEIPSDDHSKTASHRDFQRKVSFKDDVSNDGSAASTDSSPGLLPRKVTHNMGGKPDSVSSTPLPQSILKQTSHGSFANSSMDTIPHMPHRAVSNLDDDNSEETLPPEEDDESRWEIVGPAVDQAPGMPMRRTRD
uniref:G-protein coupled receptors family 1 profile domain-containing protein n=1 Tax=Amphora coffeiformis TaxID=265554 RepID=A0A7S3L8K6_9STRA|eukprot:scaffold34631_cov251-Amphora_coffeaeformis.AAC.2